ncbi:MAG: Gfo/Idh/MocA family oxidoreductase [Phycisphaerales bacterium]|nr:Gfo/Idh/MocA family oxidoreductase [Phycisphaerales bacterium]
MRQRWPVPTDPRPIVLIGAGGIVNDAHLPAYRDLGFAVSGIHDLDVDRARAAAARWAIPQVFHDLADAASASGVVFDLAVPPGAIIDVLDALPSGAAVLIQKPMGESLVDATRILERCRAKRLVAAVNFQLRFSPMMLALRDLIDRGRLGPRLLDVDVHVNVHMPWDRWPFLEALDRMEIALHTIHYVDTIRALLGEPRAAMARTVRHPDAPRLASSRTTAILDYGDDIRCALSVNHHHDHGPRHECSTLRIEGDTGAAVVTMGVNLDYPRGRPDALEVVTGDGDWESIPLEGQWFPDAFRGPMCNLQRVVAGEDDTLWTSVEDAWHTMAVVEACYASDAAGGTPVPGAPSRGTPT